MTDTTPLAILQAARELLSDPERWCQGNFVTLDAQRQPVAWCAAGALYHVDRYDGRLAELASERFRLAAGAVTISGFNDSHSHEDVLRVFDKAIYDAGIEGIRD